MRYNVRHQELWAGVLFLAVFSMTLFSCASPGMKARSARHDDAAITAEIRSEIDSDPAFHGLKIRVVTTSGEVVLSGTVPERRLKVRLIKFALRLEGVKSVKDEIRVRKD